MPGFDGTGPMGAGPMTGGARGFCNSYTGAYSGYGYGGYGFRRGFRGGFGPGFGRGRGYGRGFGWRGAYPGEASWYGPPAYNVPYGNSYPMNPEEEVNMLKNEAGYMQDELEAINKRIGELETKPAE